MQVAAQLPTSALSPRGHALRDSRSGPLQFRNRKVISAASRAIDQDIDANITAR